MRTEDIKFVVGYVMDNENVHRGWVRLDEYNKADDFSFLNVVVFVDRLSRIEAHQYPMSVSSVIFVMKKDFLLRKPNNVSVKMNRKREILEQLDFLRRNREMEMSKIDEKMGSLHEELDGINDFLGMHGEDKRDEEK